MTRPKVDSWSADQSGTEVPSNFHGTPGVIEANYASEDSRSAAKEDGAPGRVCTGTPGVDLKARRAVALFVVAALIGCTRDAPVVPGDAAADYDHDHSHTHSADAGHEHSHDAFEGDHKHGHSHGHRHAEPTRGGTVVSVGHTHHEKGVDVFHAEVLPPAGGRMLIELLVEDAGHMKPADVAEDSFDAIVGPTDGDATLAATVTFGREDGSLFAAEVPGRVAGEPKLTVVVPKIELGGERLNFSYKLEAADDDGPEADAEDAE